MKFELRSIRTKVLVWIGLICVMLAVSLLLFAYSGVYSVAASSGHVVWVKKLLEFGMQRSVITWSHNAPDVPIDLDSLARIQLGAAHFSGGCANCHGAPGVRLNAVHDHMLPPPPKLQGVIQNWTPEQLFWIVRHGIKYTGMPYWSGVGRNDEVWSVVAFLLRLPRLDEATYQEYVTGNSRPQDTQASQAVATGYTSNRLTTCDRCHDTPHAGPTSSLIPRLGGQNEEYLIGALQAYFTDNRQSGIMEPVVTALNPDEIHELARYYSTLMSPKHQPVSKPDEAQLERGRTLAQQGNSSNELPACNVCHTEQALPAYPLLAAQSATYIEAQLTLWKNEGRAQTAAGRLMADIAQRMTLAQIRDIAAYYQHLPPHSSTQTTQ